MLNANSNTDLSYNVGMPEFWDAAMKQLPATKYEASSEEAADLLEDVLMSTHSRYAREGWAIITAHEFTEDEAERLVSVMSFPVSEEDFTLTDWRAWNNAN